MGFPVDLSVDGDDVVIRQGLMPEQHQHRILQADLRQVPDVAALEHDGHTGLGQFLDHRALALQIPGEEQVETLALGGVAARGGGVAGRGLPPLLKGLVAAGERDLLPGGQSGVADEQLAGLLTVLPGQELSEVALIGDLGDHASSGGLAVLGGGGGQQADGGNEKEDVKKPDHGS